MSTYPAVERWAMRIGRTILVVALYLVVRAQRPYQPVLHRGREIAKGGRPTEQRLESIRRELEGSGVRSIVDHGCAEGYFARRLAEDGYLTLGVETNIRRLAAAHISSSLDDVHGCGFLRLDLTPDSVRRLPTFDATLSLSVLHHGLYTQGIDYTKAMLRAIRERTRTVAIIEMGQSDEVDYSWHQLLPDMGADPHAWIEELLKGVGFREVRKICEVRAWESPVKRATFAAYV